MNLELTPDEYTLLHELVEADLRHYGRQVHHDDLWAQYAARRLEVVRRVLAKLEQAERSQL